ncbi:hypothetical protein HFO56_00565 [Rhizobium laguerreae]|uniref:hypothetical protein n=1 Tax=Rhizobium laguerreae TaxID=1076926 RepID=UPI001C90D38C|nr:hypothetical protein [Rhizobium laguerreae]MBY3150921.1 hypothetical protein [Rhizobium laguerreae]
MDDRTSDDEIEEFNEPTIRRGLAHHDMPRYQDAIDLTRDTWWNLSRMKTAYKFVHDSVSETFRTQNTIGGRSLRKCFEKSDSLICETLQPLYSRYFKRTVGEGLTHHESCHVIFLPVSAESNNRETVYQLHSMRVLLTSERVETECLPLPLTFRLHAVARLLERNDAATAVMRQIGMDLVGWAAMLRLAENTSVEDLSGRMFLPAFGEGGLLCGRFKPDYALAAGVLTTVSVDGVLESTISRHPLEAALFDASTYYGEAIRTPARDNVRRELCAWRDRNGAAYDAEMADLLWPGRKLSPAGLIDYHSSHAEELEGLLAEPQIANTIAKRKGNPIVSRPECPGMRLGQGN